MLGSLISIFIATVEGFKASRDVAYDVANDVAKGDGTVGPLTDAEKVARRHLLYATAGVVGIAAAPAIYAATLKKKRKKGLTKREEMIGVSLENASAQMTGLMMAGIATPAIAAATAYILVQKLEDGNIITKGLGDAAQTLLTVAAAGPALQGIGGVVTSAFKKGK